MCKYWTSSLSTSQLRTLTLSLCCGRHFMETVMMQSRPQSTQTRDGCDVHDLFPFRYQVASPLMSRLDATILACWCMYRWSGGIAIINFILRGYFATALRDAEKKLSKIAQFDSPCRNYFFHNDMLVEVWNWLRQSQDEFPYMLVSNSNAYQYRGWIHKNFSQFSKWCAKTAPIWPAQKRSLCQKFSWWCRQKGKHSRLKLLKNCLV